MARPPTKRPAPTAAADAALAWLRTLCRALPGATEVRAWGHPNFKAGGKTFAVFERYKGEDVIAFKADLEHQRALIATDPRFYVTPYTGKHGWVSMRVAGGFDEKHARALVLRSHVLVTAKPPARRRRARAG